MRQTMKLYYEYGILIEVATNNSIAHSEPEQSFIHQSVSVVFFVNSLAETAIMETMV